MKTSDMTYVQILTKAGFVHDISPETWQLVKDEMGESFTKWVEFEDIYGGKVTIRSGNVDSTREYTPEAGAKYREMHPHEENDDGAFQQE